MVLNKNVFFILNETLLHLNYIEWADIRTKLLLQAILLFVHFSNTYWNNHKKLIIRCIFWLRPLDTYIAF